MGRKITVAVVAIGGYGSGYVHALLQPKFRKIAKIVACVDPRPEPCEDFGALKKMKVPIYASTDAFYRKAKRAPDLVILASPIQLHAAQSIQALSHGSNVLCEKPMCATVQEANALRVARDRAGKFVAIGYQRSFSPGEKALHRDIMLGLFGRPKRLRALVLNAREKEYYERNNWAGRQKSSDGRWVLDSPANNANAHYLHAMFHLLGARRDTSGVPAEVTAELYRANDITNFDTAAIRAITTDGVEVLFFTSHAVDARMPVTFRYEFEKAVVTLEPDGTTAARLKSGRTLRYGTLRRHIEDKLGEALRLTRAGKTNVTCGVETALSQTLCINGAQDSTARIVSLKKLRHAQGKGGKRVWYVPGLASVLTECYRKGKLPSELGGVRWARPGKRIDLTDYRRFPGGR